MCQSLGVGQAHAIDGQLPPRLRQLLILHQASCNLLAQVLRHTLLALVKHIKLADAKPRVVLHPVLDLDRLRLIHDPAVR